MSPLVLETNLSAAMQVQLAVVLSVVVVMCPCVSPGLTSWQLDQVTHMDTSPPPLTTPPPIVPASPPTSSFPKQAATFSLFAPSVSFAISIFVQPQVNGIRIAMIILGLTSMLLIIAGLVLGIVALAATKRHGRAGIFGKALAGTCINGLRVLVMIVSIPGLMKAMERAKAMQRQ